MFLTLLIILLRQNRLYSSDYKLTVLLLWVDLGGNKVKLPTPFRCYFVVLTCIWNILSARRCDLLLPIKWFMVSNTFITYYYSTEWDKLWKKKVLQFRELALLFASKVCWNFFKQKGPVKWRNFFKKIEKIHSWYIYSNS